MDEWFRRFRTTRSIDSKGYQRSFASSPCLALEARGKFIRPIWVKTVMHSSGISLDILRETEIYMNV